ncbi:hypothetical protein [Novosphingobium decolorationis]|uniref:Uncharacterized protein n=1 Tax=Novosphingobium decolorationis TaxID=2698673 RepID=A0ABX8E1D6_9SPHN|nr:hypothetical protein [Novosphingobium decolorationis]QVM82936.1 hypothetical protein HT578_03745 [Novosphingobium decolorationis]
MSIETVIANNALVHIGSESRILSLQDDAHVARVLREVWQLQRRSTIRDGDWNFASRRIGLPAEANVDPGEIYPWAYRYPLPGASLRLIEVLSPGVGSTYQVEGKSVLANQAGPLFVRYAIDVTEAADWDESFGDAFSWRLAWICGRRIAGSAFSEESAFQNYRDALSKAKRHDVRENPPIEQEESSWIEARFGCEGSMRPGWEMS